MSEVVVVGSGLAGLSASIRAAELGQHVTLVSPMPAERSQSVMAMGGINAALDTKGQGDSCERHFADTMGAGCDLADPVAVRRLVDSAPRTLAWLSDIGVNFTRDSQGRIDLRPFGGQKKTRTAYSGARTGKQLVTALASQVRRHEGSGSITRLLGLSLLSVARDGDGACVGAAFLDRVTERVVVMPADALVLAFGAPNGVYGKTTGSVTNDGCAGGIALRDGLRFANLEMVQFHPTTIETPGKRMLITEAARGMGGRLYVMRAGKPWYFMEEWYPEMGALMPRDVVSRSIHKVVREMGLGNEGRDEVLLDITHIPAADIERDLDEVLETCLTYRGIDPRTEPIPVYPAVHYFMGGILTDASHHTNVGRILAAGECSCQYHGANRLGGNSTLGAIHGGLVSGDECAALGSYPRPDMREAICQAMLTREEHARDAWHATAGNGVSPLAIRREMAEVMGRVMGIYRDGPCLEEGLDELSGLMDRCGQIASGRYYDYLSVTEALRVARTMVASALERRESRGAHQRSDFPTTDDTNYRRNCLSSWGDDGPKVVMQP